MALLAACSGGTPVVAPKITSFSASPDHVQAGQTSTLSWQITGNYTTVTLDQGIGDVSDKTSYQLSALSRSTTYTLSVAGTAGNDSATASVTVQPATPAV